MRLLTGQASHFWVWEVAEGTSSDHVRGLDYPNGQMGGDTLPRRRRSLSRRQLPKPHAQVTAVDCRAVGLQAADRCIANAPMHSRTDVKPPSTKIHTALAPADLTADTKPTELADLGGIAIGTWRIYGPTDLASADTLPSSDPS